MNFIIYYLIGGIFSATTTLILGLYGIRIGYKKFIKKLEQENRENEATRRHEKEMLILNKLDFKDLKTLNSILKSSIVIDLTLFAASHSHKPINELEKVKQDNERLEQDAENGQEN